MELKHKIAWPASLKPEMVFVAVSGGLDSMVLLSLLRDLKLPLTVVHINHGLRGDESNADAAFVEECAASWNIPCRSLQLTWSAGEKRSQAAYRDKRAKLWGALLSERPNAVIALGHHQDDQAETVLLRLLRGTGLKGLAAMRVWQKPIWRPLLKICRAEILSYAQAKGLEWREDSSNSDVHYERNWLRHKILPLLSERRPGVSTRLAALADEVQGIAVAAKSLRPVAAGAFGEFYRLEAVQGLSDNELHECFALNRKQTAFVKALLAKGEGRLSVEGQYFWISCQYLWRSRQAQNSLPAKRNPQYWESILGTWQGESFGEVTMNSKACREALRRAKVPLFFRNQIPHSGRDGKLLLPPKLSETYTWPESKLRFTPSAVARELGL